MERLREAVHAGHAEAAHIAMLLTTEPTETDSWDFAMAYVGRAAKAGHARAQRTLAFLAGDTDVTAALGARHGFAGGHLESAA